MPTLVKGRVDEQAWWTKHPEPQVTRAADRLVLWNYPVGKTALAAVHAEAVTFFLRELSLGAGHTGSTVSICGHASATGEASVNETLARERAEHVAEFLSGLGFEKLEVGSAGSSQPADTGSTGQALARNRRVEVTKYQQRIEPPPRLRPDKSAPAGKPSPPGSSSVGGYFEFDFELPLGEAEDANLSAKSTAVGKLKAKVARGDPTHAQGLVLSGGKLAAEFQRKLAENLNAKVGLEPGGKGERPTLKASLEGETWGVPVEVGFKTGRHFVFMELTWGTVKVPDIEIEGTTFSLELELTIQAELGPSKIALARAGLATGLTVAEGAAAGGALVVVAVIIGGTIYAAESSKQKFADLVVDTAVRDGAATRVAFEALGADTRALAAYREHRLELTKVGGQPSRVAFEAGSQLVGDYLDSLGDEERAGTIRAWTETYARNKNVIDFDKIREQILNLLGAYTNDPPPLEQLIPKL